MDSYDQASRRWAGMYRRLRATAVDTPTGRLMLFLSLVASQLPVLALFREFEFSSRTSVLILLADLTFVFLLVFVISVLHFFDLRQELRVARLQLDRAKRAREESYRALVAAGGTLEEPYMPPFTLDGGDR